VTRVQAILGGIFVALACAQPALSAGTVSFEVEGDDAALLELLKSVSLTETELATDAPAAQDVFAAARADYARLVAALYDRGYYAVEVSIRIDGVEAASIAALDAPEVIGSVTIHVDPGPIFRFSRTEVAPLAAQTTLPDGFAPGEVAHSGLVAEAAQAGVSGWRDQGHAKARVAAQGITADHRAQTLDVGIRLDPGPELRFGEMHMSGYQRLRPKRLAEIAGFPTGETFSPEKLDKVRARLRRSGIFSSVTLTETETVSAGNTLDVDLAVVEEKKRRLGFGAELDSLDGLTLSGYWLHRNLFHGGERLRFDAEISGIGASSKGADYEVGVRIDRPATFDPDTSAFIETTLSKKNEEDYDLSGFDIGFGLRHIFNDRLVGETRIEFAWSDVDEDGDISYYRRIALPTTLTWDGRDNAADATSGLYAEVGLTPFLGLAGTGSGLRTTADLRTYRSFGEGSRFVLAGRAQIGAIFGPDLADTPRDYLFYSGGGGTVRGQPYQSLGVYSLNNGTKHSGGMRFAAFSGELRAGITESIGVVGFYDAGFVGVDDFFGGDGDWHAGAGIGLRYKTAIGPIRLDLATPVGGDTGDGAQIYLGLGQAF